MLQVNGINRSCNVGPLRCFKCGLRGMFAELKKRAKSILRKACIMTMLSFDTVSPLGIMEGLITGNFFLCALTSYEGIRFARRSPLYI